MNHHKSFIETKQCVKKLVSMGEKKKKKVAHNLNPMQNFISTLQLIIK